MKPVVSLIKGEDAEESLREAMEHLGGMESVVPAGARVLIKPNLTAALPPETGAACDLKIVRGLVRMALRAGASIVVVAEGIGTGTTSLKDVKGLAEIGTTQGVEVVDLNDAPTQPVRVKDPLRVEKFDVPRAILESQVLINLAKLKVHPSAVFSLGMKNLMGALPGRTFYRPTEARALGYPTPILPGGGKKVFHDLIRDHGFEAMQEAFVDLNSAIRSHLCLIDGLHAMEGPGAPVRGKPVKMDLLICGRDLVAVEAVGMAVMGFDPDSFSYLKKAVGKGLGREDRLERIEIRGEKISSVKRVFEPPSAAALWPPEMRIGELGTRG
jgi:uncharacterized protein (DUF362 family)